MAGRVAELEARVKLLEERERDFLQVIDRSGVAYWCYSVVEERMVYVGAGFALLYELPCAAQMADPHAFLQAIAPEDLPVAVEALERQRRGLATDIEYRVVHRDGAQHWLHDRSVPIFDDAGRHVRTCGIVTEITAHKQAEAHAVQQHQLLRTIIDLLPDSVYVKDARGRKILANRVDVRYMGVPDEESALGKHDVETYAPEIAAQFRPVEEQVLREGQPSLNREEWIVVDGEARCLLTSQVPLRNAAGEVMGLVGVGRDITGFKAAQVALEELNRTLEARIEERTWALQQEIEARKRKEQDIVLSEQRLRQVIDLVPHMIYAKDTEGYYILANQACAASLGIAVDALIGQRDEEINPWATDAARFRTEDAEVIARGDTLRIGEEVVRFHDGSEHTLQTIKIPFDAAGSGKSAVLGVGIDVSEMKQAEAKLQAYAAELQLANTALQAAARHKDEFMAVMSHELRTPLSSILGLTEALQLMTYGPLTARQQRSLKLIEDSGRELLALINDLLDLSRIEAGTFHMQADLFNVVAVATTAVQRSAPAAAEKRQSIQFATDCDPVWLEGDQRRTQQIFLNLLSNAIKFTAEDGELGLRVSCDPTASLVYIHVWDRGIGIARADQERLFRPLTQLDGTLTRQYPGTGLGLALTKRLVGLQGGTIAVSSEPGAGSTFTVSFPLKSR